MTDEAFKESGLFISDSMTNFKTVTSFCNEDMLVKIFHRKLEQPRSVIMSMAKKTGIAFAFS